MVIKHAGTANDEMTYGHGSAQILQLLYRFVMLIFVSFLFASCV